MAGKARRRATPLTQNAILEAGIALADRHGISALTMRQLATELGVEAMSLYHHFNGKEQLLDGMVDLVFAEIQMPDPGTCWRQAIAERARSLRGEMLRHRWAIGLMESRRSPGVANLRHHDAVLGILRGGGMTVAQAGHAYALLDAYIYGFVLQELALPFQNGPQLEELAGEIMGSISPADYPHFTEFVVERALGPGFAYANEFAFGLEIILDGLQRSLIDPG